MRLEDRPDFFSELLPKLQELRSKFARPHWLVVDEAHHMFPADWRKIPRVAPENLRSLLMITVHPERIAPEILSSIKLVIGVGEQVDETLKAFATQAKLKAPPYSPSN